MTRSLYSRFGKGRLSGFLFSILFLSSPVLFGANVYFESDTLVRKLKARIDAAQSSIDICFYNLDSSLITSALMNAKSARGVRVRLITEDERLGRPWLTNLRSAGIPVWTDSLGPGRTYLMHNKFAIFDYGDARADNDWIWTGSYNVAAGDWNADNAIEVQDSGLAHAYTQEFEQMWGGSDDLPNPANAKFHSGKTDRLSRHQFVVGTDTFRLYFSPQDRPVDTIAKLASQAQSEIGFAIYSFTYRSLALAMKERWEKGVWVGGTFDRSESTNTYSYFDSLRRWTIPDFTDKFMGNGDMLHEKIMAIDRRIAATGSVNWSNAGNSSNDENSLLCFSSEIADRFRTEISKRFNEAGGTYAENDLNVTRVVAPLGKLEPAQVTVPCAVFRNDGAMRATFKGFCRISDSLGAVVYRDSFLMIGMASGDSVVYVFNEWTGPHPFNRYRVRCSTWVYGDGNLSNNVKTDSCWLLPLIDVGVSRIVSPTGVVDSAQMIAPSAWFHNHGQSVITFKGFCCITNASGATVYRESLMVANLAEDDSVLRSFPNWTQFRAYGWYTIRCSTCVIGDLNPVDDTASGTCRIVFYWEPCPDVPEGPKGKGVKDGGALTYWSETDDAGGTGSIFAFKGGNTNEFFCYDVAGGTWITSESIPSANSWGKKKKVGRGAGVAVIGGRVYATKGNNSLEFWRYESGVWLQLKDVPEGASRVKDGAGLVAARVRDTNFVYLFKGSRTRELYRYNTQTGVWVRLADALAGKSERPFGAGSCVATDRTSRIYALKGSQNELQAYDLLTNTWSALESMPQYGIDGRKCKAKSGAALTYSSDGSLYALKGGNSGSFWRYDCAGNSWSQCRDVPPSEGRAVKGGAALTYGDGIVYVMSGNNTRAFQAHPIAAVAVCREGRDGAAATAGGYESLPVIRVAGNPSAGEVVVSYSVPTAGSVSLRLYDATGRLTGILASGRRDSGTEKVALGTAGIARGAYFLKLSTECGTTVRKLVVK